MVSKVFAKSSKLIFKAFREEGGCLWLRDGYTEADYLECHFTEAPKTIVLDGFETESTTPRATFKLSDVRAIATDRASIPDKELFKNDGRDTLTINGNIYNVESCRNDGYGWLNVYLQKA